MILNRLKHETAAEHGAVEAQLDLLGRLGSLDNYRQLLACLWGFYAPFEQLLGAGPDWARFDVDIAQRLKAPALARDLQALGLAPAALAALPRCRALPTPTSFAHRLGCMYVLEGATLGGQLIAREARARLGLSPEHGCAFFASYGDQVGPMWRAFRALLLRVAVDAAAEADMVRGAHATFAAFGQWVGAYAHDEQYARPADRSDQL